MLCGIPIILEAVIGLITAFDIKADVLVSLALIASVIIGEDFAAGEVAFIMQLGALLEDLTVAKARAGIEKLVHLSPQTARVLRGEEEKILPAEQVQVGDVLRVLPGETVPVDGVIPVSYTHLDVYKRQDQGMHSSQNEQDSRHYAIAAKIPMPVSYTHLFSLPFALTTSMLSPTNTAIPAES